MNKERLYKHNGYGFGYDSDFNGSCLTIVKSKKDTLEVLTNIFGESANAINGILENQQQELERYKNIIDELEKYLKEENKFDEYKDITYRETMGYVLDKLKELKGSDN